MGARCTHLSPAKLCSVTLSSCNNDGHTHQISSSYYTISSESYLPKSTKRKHDLFRHKRTVSTEVFAFILHVYFIQFFQFQLSTHLLHLHFIFITAVGYYTEDNPVIMIQSVYVTCFVNLCCETLCHFAFLL